MTYTVARALAHLLDVRHVARLCHEEVRFGDVLGRTIEEALQVPGVVKALREWHAIEPAPEHHMRLGLR